MEQWVKDIIEQHAGRYPSIGQRWREIRTGDEVEIVSGKFYGRYGVSNFWTWRVIPTGEERRGYGNELTHIDPPWVCVSIDVRSMEKVRVVIAPGIPESALPPYGDMPHFSISR